jgi:3-hydroxyisobutyrate dehydrogenase-like beta-hydroxyacid dehydrogenase
MRIGFVGLGNMGQPIACNLAKAGHEVAAFNRTRARAESLKEQGVTVAATPAESAASGTVFTMLSDDHAVEEVVLGENGILQALPHGGIHISMSTISVALSQRLLAAHKDRGQRYVAAPVFGRPEAAAAAKLFVVAAGSEDALVEVEPLFKAIGQRTFVIGENAPAANVVKLSGNFLIASAIESLGEAFALVRKYDIDPQEYLELLTSTLFSAPIYKTYGGIIAEGKYEPVGFKLELGLKDIRLAMAAAEAQSVPMPVASVIRDRYLGGVANGMADADWSALAKLVAQSAGL